MKKEVVVFSEKAIISLMRREPEELRQALKELADRDLIGAFLVKDVAKFCGYYSENELAKFKKICVTKAYANTTKIISRADWYELAKVIRHPSEKLVFVTNTKNDLISTKKVGIKNVVLVGSFPELKNTKKTPTPVIKSILGLPELI